VQSLYPLGSGRERVYSEQQGVLVVEEEEGRVYILFMFNDTVEGLRAPAVKAECACVPPSSTILGRFCHYTRSLWKLY
jgi:hypothetical protein